MSKVRLVLTKKDREDEVGLFDRVPCKGEVIWLKSDTGESFCWEVREVHWGINGEASLLLKKPQWCPPEVVEGGEVIRRAMEE